jgi:hypothetical protein
VWTLVLTVLRLSTQDPLATRTSKWVFKFSESGSGLAGLGNSVGIELDSEGTLPGCHGHWQPEPAAMPVACGVMRVASRAFAVASPTTVRSAGESESTASEAGVY